MSDEPNRDLLVRLDENVKHVRLKLTEIAETQKANAQRLRILEDKHSRLIGWIAGVGSMAGLLGSYVAAKVKELLS